jgi:hypothetical protein
MLLAHLGEKVSGWPSASSFYVFMAPADTLNGFLKILPLPFQIGSQNFIEGDGGILATPLSVFL